MENRKAEVKCGEFECDGKVIFDYTNYNPHEDGGEAYEKVLCNKCGTAHSVIPWVILTLDKKNEEGHFDYHYDFYIQPGHITDGSLKEDGKAERSCPNCLKGTISFSTHFGKEALEQNGGEFYEAVQCDSCGSSFKTIPWLAAVVVTDDNKNPDSHYLYPVWVL